MKTVQATFVAVILAFSYTTLATAQDNDQADQSKKDFTECVAVSLYTVSGRAINNGELPKKTVKVPEGWSVVGGGWDGSDMEPVMIICR